MSLWQQLKKRFNKPGDLAISKQPAHSALNLTPREQEVFLLLVEGYTLQETAEQLGIKYSTANTHVTGIYKKLGVTSRAELIIRYRDFEKEDKR